MIKLAIIASGLVVVTMVIGHVQAMSVVFPMMYNLTDKQTDHVNACLKLTNDPRDARGTYGPVCGKDGFSYWNRYTMQCLQMYIKCIAKSYEGKCNHDPTWAPLEMRRDWWTLKNEDVRAILSCAEQCTDAFDPICGTDAKTYSNGCELKCVSDRFASVMRSYQGFCIQDLSDPNACPPIWQPMCGNDGETYLNLQHLRFTQRHKRDLDLYHIGECVIRPVLVKRECLNGGCAHPLYNSDPPFGELVSNAFGPAQKNDFSNVYYGPDQGTMVSNVGNFNDPPPVQPDVPIVAPNKPVTYPPSPGKDTAGEEESNELEPECES
ncbi:serine protease inhibitor dipetalogastin-like [Uranotaenia lowii]|uniref:serine protease inhibitor dipetalogastin-like n=1 Tax=Uranotaenia lowii TaxID=190385 RepID=UPI0024798361|nr:serine protease inhibitor dipetalogastin-like [Uranotaenia lowii]